MKNPLTNVPEGIHKKTPLQNIHLLILTVVASVFLGGCASANAGIALSNIPLENRKYEVLGPAETTIRWFNFDIGLVGIPMSRPPVEKAMNNLLEEKGGDALINLRYWTDRTILFMITINRFHLKADVVKLTDKKK